MLGWKDTSEGKIDSRVLARGSRWDPMNPEVVSGSEHEEQGAGFQ